jgi:hypothetical protein
MSLAAGYLEQPIDAGAIASVNFFNGRLLTGEDLSREQDAQRASHERLGRALGSGIVWGFDVSGATGPASRKAPKVTVTAGLAINRPGQALELAEAVELTLGTTRTPSDAAATMLFDDCRGVPEDTVGSGSGIFVLAVGPSRSPRGRAPASGLRGGGSAGCDAAFSVAGVQFRLVRIRLDAATMSDPALLRNRVAYRFFGTAGEPRAALARDPLGARVSTYGLIDELGDHCLHSDEIPLAVIHWTAEAGVVFVDRWMVRRRLTRASASTERPLVTGERTVADGEAMLGQFQDHIADLSAVAGAAQLAATAAFEILPPVGFLPLISRRHRTGFAADAFFTGVVHSPPRFVEGARLESLVRDALVHPPCVPASREAIRLYRVVENARAAGSANPPRQVLVFANGHVSYRGTAHFDLAHADYASADERVDLATYDCINPPE